MAVHARWNESGTSLLNGEPFPDCGSLLSGSLGLNRWRLVPDPNPLTCDEPWIP